ncbi:MAG TPA: RagB/SusD family nutrient uptake outer membrane protein [Chitinophagaceae bacterium]|nr:RagB/SusD family nutrient uptake outer membrane protein [Chitinophagaceae bacterium]
MKKNLLLNIYLLALVIIYAGCTKQLDTKPTSSIDSRDALKTSDDVLGALKGTYADLGSYSFYGGDIFVESELLADDGDINWSGTYQDLTQIYDKNIPVTNGFVASNWEQAYRIINEANVILDSINIVVEANRDEAAAEAKFIRGCVYFDLVRLFAKAWNDGSPSSNLGVPLILKSTDPTKDLTASAKVSRNTVAEVYTQVIQDLSDAEQDIADYNGFYANKAAAAGMLARVYLQKGDYANAASAANRSITYALDNGFHLESSYSNAFPFVDPPAAVKNSSEDLFTMQVTPTSGINDFQTYYSAYGRGDIQINDQHLELYNPSDDRLNMFYESGGSIYTGKFDNIYGNVHIMRLAEQYLIRAEANFRMHTAVGARPVNDINLIRERVGLDDYTSADLTLDEILAERKLELAFEGFALGDLKRTETNLTGLPWNSPKLILPIPKREIQVNSNLVQNEGY